MVGSNGIYYHDKTRLKQNTCRTIFRHAKAIQMYVCDFMTLFVWDHRVA